MDRETRKRNKSRFCGVILEYNLRIRNYDGKDKEKILIVII